MMKVMQGFQFSGPGIVEDSPHGNEPSAALLFPAVQHSAYLLDALILVDFGKIIDNLPIFHIQHPTYESRSRLPSSPPS
jgi:hypothetical protein